MPLVIQYPLQDKGTAEDFGKRNEVESLCTDILGWSGNGDVEGAEAKPGRMNVFLHVMDADVAVRTLTEALDEDDLLEGAIIAIAREGEPPRVLWPKDFQGDFQV